jgi:hypothetical protein
MVEAVVEQLISVQEGLLWLTELLLQLVAEAVEQTVFQRVKILGVSAAVRQEEMVINAINKRITLVLVAHKLQGEST